MAVGANHIMCLDLKGKVFTWGTPEQNQLGRRCVQRDLKESALRPGGVAFKRGTQIQKIACGSYHSFAIDQKGQVYAWGLNNFAELGIEEGAGEADAAILDTTLVTSLSDYKIVDIQGGNHHSLACTDDGKLITWGRIDGHQVGLPDDAYNNENAVFDERGKPRILKKPTVIDSTYSKYLATMLPGTATNTSSIAGVSDVVLVNAGTDNSFAITGKGKAFAWGFSANYQTGLGVGEDVKVPTLIDNSAVRDKHLTYAGCGGQFSILAGPAK